MLPTVVKRALYTANNVAGSSHVDITRLTWTPPGNSSDEERLKFLDRAWELGATNWDTSDVYGDNEDLLGKWFALHPERRKDIFLATKFAGKIATDWQGSPSFVIDSSPEYTRVACERSLERLKVEPIDLYYIHRLDETTPIEKTVEEMVKLKK